MRRLIIVIVSIATVVSAAVLGGVGYEVASGHGNGTAPSRTGAITSCYATGNGDLRVVAAGDRCRSGENRLTLTQRATPVVHVVGRTGQPPYLDGFRAYNGPPFGDLAYFKDGSGVVHLQVWRAWQTARCVRSRRWSGGPGACSASRWRSGRPTRGSTPGSASG